MFLAKHPIFKIVLLLCLTTNLFGHDEPSQKKSLIRFTENKNQWDSFIKFRAQLDGGALFLQSNRLTYHFYDKDGFRSMHAKPKVKPKDVKSSWFHVNFINSNKEVLLQKNEAAPDYNNYYIGKDQSKWASNVKNYKEIIYADLWDGINMQIIGADNSMKYNFYVKPGKDASKVQLKFDGVKNISIKNKQLVIQTHINEIVEHAPYAYQTINGEKIEVPCNFKLKGNTLSYEFPNGYNKSIELVIDPVLVFACSSGSTADNFGMTATYDAQGNLYSGGTCFNIGFPTVNAYDATYNSLVQYGQTDVVITKYDASGTFLQYSTYLGGATDADVINSIIVDGQNNLFAYGVTASTDFPVTVSYDNTFNGGQTLRFYYNGSFFENGTDIYVSKLSAGGNNLLASTYIGGSGNDGNNYTDGTQFVGTINPYGPVNQPRYDSLLYNYGDQNRGEIQIDHNGDILIASSTKSADFPILNGFDNNLSGTQDAVVFKLDNTLSTLIWSTYLGGTSMDAGNAINFDESNNVFVTGGTCSPDFPVTTGTYQTTYNGGEVDGYIAKISSTGNSLLAATFLGTSLYDACHFVQTDKNNNIYVLGQSEGNMPVVNVGYSNANGKIFISKFNNNLDFLIFSTVIGSGQGSVDLSPSAFLVDYCENIYLSGWGGNIITGPATNNMPLSANATQTTTDGFNFYLMALEHDALSLLYGSYFGGANSQEHVDGGTSRFDKKGIIYQSVCAGCGGNDDFPVTPGSWPRSLYGNNINQASNCNNGTFKLDFQVPLVIANFTTNDINGCAPLTVNFTNESVGTHYLWDFGSNDTTSLIYNPTHTFNTPGTYTVNLYVVDSARCNIADTASTVVIVHPVPDAQATAATQICSSTFDFTNTSSGANGLQYNWDFGDNTSSALTNPSHTYTSNGTYTVALNVTSDMGCEDSIKFPVQLTLIADSIGIGGAYCADSIVPVQLFSSGGTSYAWTPTTGLNNANSATPIAQPTITTTYSVTISETDFSGDVCASTQTVTIQVNPSVTADFTSIPNVCGNTYQFNDASASAITTWNWNFGDTFFSPIQNPSHSYANPGTYTVTLAVQNNFGCNDTIAKPIVLPSFNPLGISAAQTICYGGSVQLNASGGVAYQWSPAPTLSDTTIANPTANPITTTVYTVTVTSINSIGDTCFSNLYTTVNVATLSNLQLATTANPDTIYVGDYSNINSNIGSPYSISWSPNYQLSSNTAFDPIATPQHTTTYAAIAQDANGCKYLLDSVTIVVLSKVCDEGTVFIPNTFTPNGDGSNDILYVRSNHTTEIYFAVYNRWGEMVFETTDITKGWDGIYKGMKADPGVFGYYVRFTCNNEEKSFKKGNITLIR